MATTDTDWAALTSVAGTLRTALQTQNLSLVMQYALELKVIMIVLGSSVSASGTNVQLAIESASSLIADAERFVMYVTKKASNNSRFGRLGLTDTGGRVGGASSGVILE